MATVTLNLKTGSLPNFISIDNGKERLTAIDVGDLTKDELEAYIRQWAQDLRKHAAKRKQFKKA